MRAWILAFSLGVFLGSFIPVLPAFSLTLMLWLPLCCRYWWQTLHLAAAFCLGLWCLLSQAIWHQGRVLPPELEQADLRVSVEVVGLPLSGSLRTRISARILQGCIVLPQQPCTLLPALTGIRIRLNDYNHRQFSPGQRLELVVRLKRPHGLANPGGIDSERRQFAEKISAEGYIRDILSGPAREPGLHFLVPRWRQHFLAWLDTITLHSGAIIKALTIGVRTGFTDKQRQLMMLTGTSHLMVISGLHVGLVAWLGFHLGCFAWRHLLLGHCSWPAQRAGACLALVVACFYGAMAGFSLPVQRALVMVCCVMSGTFLVRQTRPLNSLAIALLIVLLLDPLAVREAGFWLSFGAVAVLLTGIDQREVRVDSIAARVLSLCKTQGRVFLGLLPLTLFLFGQVSLWAPFINLLAIPFIGLCIVPLCLAAMLVAAVSFDMAAMLLLLPDQLLAWYETILSAMVAAGPSALVRFPALGWWQIIGLSALVAIFLMARRNRLRALAGVGMVLVLALAWQRRPYPMPPGTFTLSVLDVGQGLAAVIQTRHHVLLFDTGAAYPDAYSASQTVLLPYLRDQGWLVPDTILVSHGDNDHAGGAAVLAAAFPQTRFLVGEALPFQTNATMCRAGQHWRWDDVTFEIMYPPMPGRSGNTASCVLRVSTGAYSVLLPGDIERQGELALVRRLRTSLQSDVLIAPHHGSTTSSTPPFVRHVQPAHVVFTTGYLNRFGHPRPAVLARYEAVGSTIHLTSHHGMVRFRLSARQGVESVSHYRDMHPRFWAGRP